MNLDMLITLCIKLMGASSYDELTEHNLTVDPGGKLTKVVLESAKVRVTIERLPIGGATWIGGTRLPDGSITNITGSPNILQWLQRIPSFQMLDQQGWYVPTPNTWGHAHGPTNRGALLGW